MINKRCFAWAGLLYLGASLVGLGVAYAGGLFTTTASNTPSSPYKLTLVETMNMWNPSNPMGPTQASFFVLGSNGLQSAASITLPANRLIQLTIVSYDGATPNSTNQMGVVTGTVGNDIYLMNGTIAMMGNMTWGMNVSSIPAAGLAHTFTVPQLGINIPVVGMSTVVAYIKFDKAGTYAWVCETPCGFPGPTAASSGAMATSGWMQGQIVVQ